MRRTTLVVTLFVASLSLTGAIAVSCGDGDDDYGDTCDSDRECDGVCAEGRDFPDGLCTYRCDDQGDCPSGYDCIEKEGGICLEECSSDRECEDRYGRRWTCKEEKLEGRGGKDSVCIGD